MTEHQICSEDDNYEIPKDLSMQHNTEMCVNTK